MKVHAIPVDQIKVASNRQRQEFDYTTIADLAGSISQNGLLSPIVVRKGEGQTVQLVAGERRLRALDYLWTAFGESLRCGGSTFKAYEVPCIHLGDLSEVDAFEVELEENIRRVDLTWQERAQATTKLKKFRDTQAQAEGKAAAPLAAVATESHPHIKTLDAAYEATRKELIVSRHLGDADVAGAKTLDDAVKIVLKKESVAKDRALALLVGKTFSSADHTLFHGSCLDILPTLSDNLFDCILSDPPYGMGAQDFGDSGGLADGGHFYDDSYANWLSLMGGFIPHSYRLAKAQAHLYLFCDIDRFVELREFVSASGWKTHRTPIVYVNPNGMRAPWPQHGPQRKWQLILYAIKGEKYAKRLAPDVITCTSDPNLGHPATKPVKLLVDLLSRSCAAGDTVLDPFLGSGSLVVAAHSLKCKATGIELDSGAYGIALKRVAELK
jgi:site-specific DNA-methyltransferase (adenine-specific)